MVDDSTKCPKCGSPASGKFCGICGTPLHTACTSCGRELSAGAKFCLECGKPVGRGTPAGSNMPLVVGGGAAVLVALLALVWFTASRRPVEPPPVAAGLGAATTDISQMSPREQANRLFDRVMAAQERGDQQEVDFFAPMAIQTHALLGALDNDARYHLGLLHTVGGSREAALVQADSLELAVPGHLFAAMLRATVAVARGDDAELAGARQAFLEAYDREMASASPEYTEHATSIAMFLAEARNQ